MVCRPRKRSVCPASSIRRRATFRHFRYLRRCATASFGRPGELAQLTLPRYPPRGDFPHFALPRYPSDKTAAHRAANGVKILVPPFFDRFSPFSTVFPADPNRDSPEESGARPFSPVVRPLKTVKPVTSLRMKPVGSSCADSALDVPIVTNLGLAKSHSKKHLSAAMPPKQEPTGQVGLPHQAWVLQWATTTSRSS
jgi:hypothetical protein